MFPLALLKSPKVIAALVMAILIAVLYIGFRYYKHKAADLREVVAVQKAEIKQAGQAIQASADHQQRMGKIASVTRSTAKRIQEATQGTNAPRSPKDEAGWVESCESQPCPPCPETNKEVTSDESRREIIAIANGLVDRWMCNDGRTGR